jgi:hypothetical protein
LLLQRLLGQLLPPRFLFFARFFLHAFLPFLFLRFLFLALRDQTLLCQLFFLLLLQLLLLFLTAPVEASRASALLARRFLFLRALVRFLGLARRRFRHGHGLHHLAGRRLHRPAETDDGKPDHHGMHQHGIHDGPEPCPDCDAVFSITL